MKIRRFWFRLLLLCTKTVDSVFRAFWLASQTWAIQRYSQIPFQGPSDAKLVRVSLSKIVSRFAAVTSEEILEINVNEEAVPEKHEEGDEIWYGSFYR